MVPRMQRKTKNSKPTSRALPRQNKWTQTTPGIKNTVTAAMQEGESILPKISISALEKRSRYEDMATPLRSLSVPLNRSPRVSRQPTGDVKSRDCLQKTGLPPIVEGVVPDYLQVPKTVDVLSDSTKNRFRRVQEQRSNSIFCLDNFLVTMYYSYLLYSIHSIISTLGTRP